MLFRLATCTLLAMTLLAPPRGPATEAFDPSTIRVIPPLLILRRATFEDRGAVLWAPWKDAALARVHAMPPPAQTLFWLLFLESSFESYPGTAKNPLDAFFADNTRYYAPQVRDALIAAGLTREGAIIAQAIGMFHPPYPIDERELYFGPDTRTARFDRDSMARLGEGFAGRDVFVGQILAYVARTPALVAWTEARRRELTDEQRLDTLIERLAQLKGAIDADTATIAQWPEPYRIVLLAASCASDFADKDEDHMADFLAGNDPARVVATAAAFRAIGRPTDAGQLERGLAMFPSPVPATKAARETLEWADKSALAKRLDDVRGPIGNPDDQNAMLGYAVRHGILPR